LPAATAACRLGEPVGAQHCRAGARARLYGVQTRARPCACACA